MKVEGPGKTNTTAGAKKAGKASRSGGASFASSLENSADSDGVDAVSGAAAGMVGAVDALIALQEVDSPDSAAGEGALSGDRERRAQKWGNDMLEGLEEIRIGFLTGRIPHHRLNEIAKAASDGKSQSSDPRLSAILEEIELRALVELAKLQH